MTTTIGSNHDACYSINIQSDGKIVLAGDYYNTVMNDKEMAIVRYENITLDIAKSSSPNNSIQLFPNPVSNLVKVTGTDANGELTFYSMEGKEVMRKETTSHETFVNVTKLTIGIYYLVYKKENSAVFLRMIKSE